VSLELLIFAEKLLLDLLAWTELLIYPSFFTLWNVLVLKRLFGASPRRIQQDDILPTSEALATHHQGGRCFRESLLGVKHFWDD